MYRIILTLIIMAWAATAPAEWYNPPGGAATSVTDGDTLLIRQGTASRTATRAQIVEGSVRTTGAQTVNGVKSFTDTIVGSVTGNAGTVTGGAYLGTNNTFTGINSFEQAIIAPNIVPGVYFVGGPGMETLQTAVTALGSTPATLRYGTNQTLTGALTVPETLVLAPYNRAQIVYGAHSLTVNSSTAGWGRYPVLSGTGTVVLGQTVVLLPEWFGATPVAPPAAAVDSTAAMQRAVACAAASPGAQRIDLGPCYYYVSTLTLSAADLTLAGTGALAQTAANVGNHIVSITGSNVTIDGIRFVGPVTAGNTNYAEKAAVFVNADGATIRNCRISGKQSGIYGQDGTRSNLTITGNRITHSLGGIVLRTVAETANAANKASNLRIVGNVVTLAAGFNPDGDNIRGIVAWDFNGAVIEDNVSLGAQLSFEVWWSTNVAIHGNVADTWLSVDTVTNTGIIGNTIDFSRRPAIYSTFPVGLGYGNGHGIEVVRGKYVTVARNILRNLTGNGIYTGYPGNVLGTTESNNITIDGNILEGCAASTSTYASLMLGAIRDSVISNNLIVNSGAATGSSRSIFSGGYVLTGSGYYSPAYNLRFVGNTVRGDKNADLAAVTIHYAKDVVFERNTIENSAGSGLQLGEQATFGMNISDCVIRNNAKYGISYGTGNMYEAYMRNCDLRGNGLGPILLVGADTVSEHLLYRDCMGIVHTGATPKKGTFEAGDLYNISHATNKWLRATAAGTYGTLTSVTASTTNGSTTATVNNHGALKLVTGQYITIAGVTGAKQVRAIRYTTDANGFTGATITLSSAADATVTGAAVAYSAPTVAQVL